MFIDVQILAHGVIQMRESWAEETSLDICESITIASAAMKYFRMGIGKDIVGITPHNGYEFHFKQSKIGRTFLKWYQLKNGVKLETADSGRERQIGRYRVDGFLERPGQKDLVVEVNG
jgi:hypothetical protein